MIQLLLITRLYCFSGSNKLNAIWKCQAKNIAILENDVGERWTHTIILCEVFFFLWIECCLLFRSEKDMAKQTSKPSHTILVHWITIRLCTKHFISLLEFWWDFWMGGHFLGNFFYGIDVQCLDLEILVIKPKNFS